MPLSLWLERIFCAQPYTHPEHFFIGIAIMYFTLALLCLGFLLIANLHLLTAYRCQLIQSHLTKLIIASFFLPLLPVVPVTVRKQIEYLGMGSICFVSSKAASAFFFYPLAAAVSLGTLLHLGTIIATIKV